jgi:hypothetical protein
VARRSPLSLARISTCAVVVDVASLIVDLTSFASNRMVHYPISVTPIEYRSKWRADGWRRAASGSLRRRTTQGVVALAR